VDQVVHIARLSHEYQRPLTNIVYMGMGEPLLNYANVMRSAERINAEDGLGMSYRRITVSTAGIAKMIRKLGDDGAKFNLALSPACPHGRQARAASCPSTRERLAELMDALRYYTRLTRKTVTFEYILFRDFNDGLEDAQRTGAPAAVNAKVNLIEYNATDDGRFQRTPLERALQFQNHLESKGITARIRRSRGRDIDAACGQLANKNETAVASGERVLKTGH
jgi:23S rRNA (adenine2503-C2)-methyltransferase